MAELAAAAIAAAFLFSGYGVLAAAGMLPEKPGRAVGAIGLAYVAGLSATMLVAIVLLCLGVPVHAGTFALISVAVGAAGLGVAVRGGRVALFDRVAWRPSGPLPSLRGRPVAVLLVVVAAVFAVLGYRAARVMPLTAWDAWSIWARKATILLDHGTLPVGVFASHSYAFMHPDYPMLVPMLESIWFRFVGGPDTQSLHIQFWLLYVASLGAAAHLVSRRISTMIWVPLIGLVAALPAVTDQLTTMYADVPMSLLLMLGVLLLGLWIADGRRAHLALATLFLAAAANTKNEGLTAAACALVVALLMTAIKPAPGRRGRDIAALLTAGAGFMVAIAPWRIWLAVHHITGDMSIGKGLDPSYVFSRTSRISPTLTGLYHRLTDQHVWLFVLPLGISVVIACLLVRRLVRPAAFYALTGVGIFLTLVWAYVINPNPIGWYLSTSASRAVDGLMFVAVAALLQLTGNLVPRPEPAPARAPDNGESSQLDLVAA